MIHLINQDQTGCLSPENGTDTQVQVERGEEGGERRKIRSWQHGVRDLVSDIRHQVQVSGIIPLMAKVDADPDSLNIY
jgi:hypothetical protein